MMRTFAFLTCLLFATGAQSAGGSSLNNPSPGLASGGTATGDITMDTGTQIFLPDGTQSDPPLAFSSSTGTGLRYQDPHRILFVNDGKTRLTQKEGGLEFSASGSPRIYRVRNALTDPQYTFVNSTGMGLSSDKTNVAITHDNSVVTEFTSETSAVNHLKLTASATGNAVIETTAGSDANVGLTLNTKGTGDIQINPGGNLGLYGTTPAAQPSAFTITNDTTDDTFDANSTTTAELADVLATLIKRLDDPGFLAATQ